MRSNANVDALCDGADVVIAGVMQHIEEAGVHSGDSACTLPPYNLPASIIEEMEHQAVALAMALGVIGLMNIQFAVKDGKVYLIEVNPRASRTVPFVAKAIGRPVAKIAARVMAGTKLASLPPLKRETSYMSVKEAVFRSTAFPAPIRCSARNEIDRRSDGIDADFPMAFAKAQMGAGMNLPGAGRCSCRSRTRQAGDPRRDQADGGAGLQDHRHRRTAQFLAESGMPVERVNKVAEGRPHVVDKIVDGEVALIFNTRGLAEPQGLSLDPRLGAQYEAALLHHRRGLRRRRARDCSPEIEPT